MDAECWGLSARLFTHFDRECAGHAAQAECAVSYFKRIYQNEFNILNVELPEVSRQDHWRLTAQCMDLDGDGIISTSEFRRYCTDVLGKSDLGVDKIYKSMDAARDGKVTVDECHKFLSAHGGQLEKEVLVSETNFQAGGYAQEAFAESMKAVLEAGGLHNFKAAARKILATDLDGVEPWLSVGPVIGKVTDSTARILVECTHHNVQVTCVLTPEGSSERLALTQALERNRPRIFVFEDLKPGTLYDVSFEGALMMLDDSRFRTLPKGGWNLKDGASPKLAVASCNSVYTSREKPANSQSNLWNYLKTQMKGGDKVDYLLHMGDNVYNDIEWHLIEKGKKGLDSFDCKWGLAHEWLKSLPEEKWTDHEEEVRLLFASTYRETWGYPPQRWVMAHVPNMMMFDDHDMRDDWGDRAGDNDGKSLDVWLATIAYHLVQDYQMILHRDPPSGTRCDHDFHFHAFGDVGLAFLDLRACKTFHKKVEDSSTPMLGAKQWRVLEEALANNQGAEFAACKALLVFSPEPVAYVSPKPTLLAGNTVCDDLLGQWSNPKHQGEVPRLMKTMTSWRNAHEGRAVLLLGGDVHEGGWTDITAEDGDKQFIRQLTTSAIANKMTAHHEAVAVIMTRDVAGAMEGFSCAPGWHYQHYDWTNKRNYAMVDFEQNGRATVIGGTLISSENGKVRIRQRHTTAEKGRGLSDRAVELGKKVGNHAKHALAMGPMMGQAGALMGRVGGMFG